MRRICSIGILFLLFAGGLSAAASGGRRRAAPHPFSCSSGVVANASGVADLVLDEVFVYFGDSSGSLWRVPKSGGSPTLVTTIDGVSIYFVAVDTWNVYFDARSTATNLDSVYVVPKEGGTAKLLVSGLPSVMELIPAEQWLYVLSAGSMQPPPWPSNGQILRVRKDGSAMETLASSLRAPMAMRLDGEAIYYTEAGTSTTDRTGGVRRMNTAGGAMTIVANLPLAWALAQDASSLYVLRVIGSDLGAVDKVSKLDGTITPFLPAISFEPFEPMEVVGGSLVFMHIVSSSSARIEAITLSGTDRRTIREHARNFPQFAVDSCAVYFSTPTAIERAAF